MSSPLVGIDPQFLELLRRLVERFLVPDPYPAINFPTSGSIVPGGVNNPVTVSTNRIDAPHFVRVREGSASGPVWGSPVPVDFSGGSPRTVSVPMPPPSATTQYVIEIYSTAGGDTHRVFVTVSDLAVNLTADPPPTEGEYEQDRDTTFKVTVAGGTAPYTYVFTWKIYDDDSLLSTNYSTPVETNNPYLDFDMSFPTPGHWKVRVTVTDGSDPGKSGTSFWYEFNVTPS